MFLARYRETGSGLLAAETAEVDEKTVRKYRRANPEFFRRVLRARRLFRASMEYELVKQARGESKGSFLAAVARIKASSRKLHALYSEKVADATVLNLTINDNRAIVSDAAARALLARSLPQATPATLALLAGDPPILEAEVVTAVSAPRRPEEDRP